MARSSAVGKLPDIAPRASAKLRARGRSRHLPIRCQRQKGEVLAIHIVLEIEDAWEAGSSGEVFGPGAVIVLAAQEELHAANYGAATCIPAGAKPHNCPGSLAGSTWSSPFESGKVVRLASFAPAAIIILTTFQPVAAAADPFLVHVFTDRGEPSQDLPGSVDVIDTPASVPRAIGLLSAANHFDSSADWKTFSIEAAGSEQLKDAAGQVGARWVEDGVVVSEGHMLQPASVDILVKGGPSSIIALEGK